MTPREAALDDYALSRYNAMMGIKAEVSLICDVEGLTLHDFAELAEY